MKTRKITFGAMCLALSLLLPQAFHLIGMQQAGSVFLPMHIPVFIGGMLLGPIYGLFLGIFAPLTSFVVTGMPTAERVLFMMSELATYGMVSGLLFHHFHFSKKKLGSVMALLLSMIAGRLVYGFVISIATYVFGIPLGGIQAVIMATMTGLQELSSNCYLSLQLLQLLIEEDISMNLKLLQEKLNKENYTLIADKNGEYYTSYSRGDCTNLRSNER